MKFNIINHGTKEIEIYYDAEAMVCRIVELTKEHFLCGRLKPTHLAVDESGITIIMDFE